MFGWCGFGWKHDPGPCPVDDTPHTACTPESVAALRVRAQRPRSLDKTIARLQNDQAVTPEALDVAPAAATFTQKTYRRAVHGKRLRGARARN